MALPLMLGICLVAGVACFLTNRATKAANKVTHDGDSVNSRPLAPATSPNNLNRRSQAAPATSSNNLNRRPPAAPATSSDNLNRRPRAPAISSYNLNRWPSDPDTSFDNDLNCRSPAAPTTSPDNLNRLPSAPATLSDNLNLRPLDPATSSNNPVMHVGDMAAELAKYEVCPLVHSTDAVRPVEVHLQTNIVEEVKINELSNGIAEGLENNDVFKGSLGDGLGAVTSVVLELDDNIDVITPLVEEADVLNLEEEVVNLSGGVIGSGEGWWVAVKKWVEERFRWVKGKVKRRAEWVIDEADVLKLEEEAANLSGSVIGSGEGWWVAMKKWVEERFQWGKGKCMLDPDVDMHRTLRRLVWVVVDSMVESKNGIGRYKVLLKMYRILINEFRCH